MKIQIATALAFVSISANAANLEVSAGKTLDAKGMAWSIGATGMVTEHIRYHAGLASLGAADLNTSDTAISAQDEIDAHEAPGKRYWVEPTRTNELYATVAYEFEVFGFTVAPEFGLAAYKPMPQADILPGETLPPSDNRTNFTYVSGLSIGRGNVSLIITRQNISEYVDWTEGWPKSMTVTTSLRYKF